MDIELERLFTQADKSTQKELMALAVLLLGGLACSFMTPSNPTP